jgi:hypothetical protein
LYATTCQVPPIGAKIMGHVALDHVKDTSHTIGSNMVLHRRIGMLDSNVP